MVVTLCLPHSESVTSSLPQKPHLCALELLPKAHPTGLLSSVLLQPGSCRTKIFEGEAFKKKPLQLQPTSTVFIENEEPRADVNYFIFLQLFPFKYLSWQTSPPFFTTYVNCVTIKQTKL